jgi:hypothetical protein
MKFSEFKQYPDHLKEEDSLKYLKEAWSHWASQEVIHVLVRLRNKESSELIEKLISKMEDPIVITDICNNAIIINQDRIDIYSALSIEIRRVSSGIISDFLLDLIDKC